MLDEKFLSGYYDYIVYPKEEFEGSENQKEAELGLFYEDEVGKYHVYTRKIGRAHV